MKASELARMSARHGSGILSLSQGHTAVQMCRGQLGLSFFLGGGSGLQPIFHAVKICFHRCLFKLIVLNVCV